MPLPLFIVDAFTSRPFAGNPAAVCLLDAPRDDAWMQSLAMEMNLSETAFLLRDADAWRLRWFTPRAEVDLCGHATLASAHVLWLTGEKDEILRFQTRSGLLTAARDGDAITLDFPAVRATPCGDDPGIAEAIGASIRYLGRNGMDYLVEVADEPTLRAVAPDFAALGKLPVRGVIVTTASATPQYDFVSRFFAPRVGVPEDPVTGSAHCALAPFWAARLGKDEMNAYQASERGGEVRVTLRGERVLLGGRAVTVVRGAVVV